LLLGIGATKDNVMTPDQFNRILREADFSNLLEKWSDAARKAAAAGRSAGKKMAPRVPGSNQPHNDARYDARMNATRAAFRKAGGKRKIDVDIARRAIMATRSHDRDAPLARNERKWMRRKLYKQINRNVNVKGKSRGRYPRSEAEYEQF
jgi:hypothetical protein